MVNKHAPRFDYEVNFKISKVDEALSIFPNTVRWWDNATSLLQRTHPVSLIPYVGFLGLAGTLSFLLLYLLLLIVFASLSQASWATWYYASSLNPHKIEESSSDLTVPPLCQPKHHIWLRAFVQYPINRGLSAYSLTNPAAELASGVSASRYTCFRVQLQEIRLRVETQG